MADLDCIEMALNAIDHTKQQFSDNPTLKAELTRRQGQLEVRLAYLVDREFALDAILYGQLF